MEPAIDRSPAHLLARLCGLDTLGLRPKAMLVLAHPGDEVVGASTLLPSLSLATFAFVTDGAPEDFPGDAFLPGIERDAFADMRRGELVSALDSVGIPWERLEFAACAERQAYRQLTALALWLEIVMREHWPSVVLTHPYEGGHPDHDATAFAVHLARHRIRAAGDPAPTIAEFTSYHAAGETRRFGEFLPGGGEVHAHRLTGSERALKRQLLGCYATQREAWRNVPLEFERFRVAPDYNFAAPPHRGPLYYERFAWAPSAAEWCERARLAREQILSLSPADPRAAGS